MKVRNRRDKCAYSKITDKLQPKYMNPPHVIRKLYKVTFHPPITKLKVENLASRVSSSIEIQNCLKVFFEAALVSLDQSLK